MTINNLWISLKTQNLAPILLLIQNYVILSSTQVIPKPVSLLVRHLFLWYFFFFWYFKQSPMETRMILIFWFFLPPSLLLLRFEVWCTRPALCSAGNPIWVSFMLGQHSTNLILHYDNFLKNPSWGVALLSSTAQSAGSGIRYDPS